jgi:TPR repeat protein
VTDDRPADATAAGADLLSRRDRRASFPRGGRAAAGLFLCLGFAAAAAIQPRPAVADFADAAAAYDAGDIEAAAKEWRRLAEEGDPSAQVALADLYMAGQGVPRDRTQARALYRKAAMAGSRVAQLNLGDIHRRGLGVRPDLVRAYAWFLLAADQGSGWAADQLRQLRPRLSDQDLMDARALARGFAESQAGSDTANGD